FVEAYPRLFWHVYRRLYRNLREQARITEAAVQVLADFLVRWGATLRQIGPQELEYIRELCDRTCAKLNGTPSEQFSPSSEPDTEPVPLESEVRRRRLPDTVLKAVRDELSCINSGLGENERQAAAPTGS